MASQKLLAREERHAPLFRALRDTTSPNFNARVWKISLWEAIAAAVLLCDEPLRNKLEFLFDLADVGYIKQLGYTDFAALATALVRLMSGTLPFRCVVCVVP